MKKIILLLLLSNIVLIASAQVKITEGTVLFDITYPELTKEMKQMESMLPKSMDVHFKGDRSRAEMTMGGGKTTSISSSGKKEIVVLMDMMGKKMALKQTEADLNKKEAEMKKNGQYPTDIKVTKLAETKDIAGYKCTKATINYKMNGKAERMDCYYTTALPKMLNSMDNPAMKSIEGFMMEYNISQGGMKMRIRAKSVKKESVPESMFTIPSDYKIMTVEEVQKMMGGAGKE